MSTFDLYAMYYDLLYDDKDYDAEAAFVAQLIDEQTPQARRILELGCGTGKHALALARRGYSLFGLDMSAGMIAQANERLSQVQLPLDVTVNFQVGDVRSEHLRRKFDAAISLFHVVSYQNSDSDLLGTMLTAAEHLNAGSAFVFDCWYGPAVLTYRPEVRVKRKENRQIKVVRLAEPVMHPNRNVVDVNYTVWIEEKQSKAITCLSEVHSMRYLFVPETQMMLASCGFDVRHVCEWISGKDLDVSTWSATFVAVKR